MISFFVLFHQGFALPPEAQPNAAVIESFLKHPDNHSVRMSEKAMNDLIQFYFNATNIRLLLSYLKLLNSRNHLFTTFPDLEKQLGPVKTKDIISHLDIRNEESSSESAHLYLPETRFRFATQKSISRLKLRLDAQNIWGSLDFPENSFRVSLVILDGVPAIRCDVNIPLEFRVSVRGTARLKAFGSFRLGSVSGRVKVRDFRGAFYIQLAKNPTKGQLQLVFKEHENPDKKLAFKDFGWEGNNLGNIAWKRFFRAKVKKIFDNIALDFQSGILYAFREIVLAQPANFMLTNHVNGVRLLYNITTSTKLSPLDPIVLHDAYGAPESKQLLFRYQTEYTYSSESALLPERCAQEVLPPAELFQFSTEYFQPNGAQGAFKNLLESSDQVDFGVQLPASLIGKIIYYQTMRGAFCFNWDTYYYNHTFHRLQALPFGALEIKTNKSLLENKNFQFSLPMRYQFNSRATWQDSSCFNRECIGTLVGTYGVRFGNGHIILNLNNLVLFDSNNQKEFEFGIDGSPVQLGQILRASISIFSNFYSHLSDYFSDPFPGLIETQKLKFTKMLSLDPAIDDGDDNFRTPENFFFTFKLPDSLF
ncbi:MAG: hypothetical protein HYS98_00970 [Deltaproteobacteria bacterium]|nr:hypothetical protein [Deltaproteobacteria bacterium]